MKEKIKEITHQYPPERRYALAIMQDIQREFNYIPEDTLPLIKEHVGVSEGNLYAMATFYKALSLKPKGKHIIKVCDGTACHMRGAINLVGGIERHLGITAGERTEDGQFSAECVNCVGSCALAPVVIVGETYYSKVGMEALPGILDAYKPGGEKDE